MQASERVRRHSVCTKNIGTAKAIPIFLVRKTGLEPVRCKPHAPQTCASASSATSAYKTPLFSYTKKVSVESSVKPHAPQTYASAIARQALLAEVLRTVAVPPHNTFIFLHEEGLRGSSRHLCREHLILYTIKLGLSIVF